MPNVLSPHFFSLQNIFSAHFFIADHNLVCVNYSFIFRYNILSVYVKFRIILSVLEKYIYLFSCSQMGVDMFKIIVYTYMGVQGNHSQEKLIINGHICSKMEFYMSLQNNGI